MITSPVLTAERGRTSSVFSPARTCTLSLPENIVIARSSRLFLFVYSSIVSPTDSRKPILSAVRLLPEAIATEIAAASSTRVSDIWPERRHFTPAITRGKALQTLMILLMETGSNFLNAYETVIETNVPARLILTSGSRTEASIDGSSRYRPSIALKKARTSHSESFEIS